MQILVESQRIRQTNSSGIETQQKYPRYSDVCQMYLNLREEPNILRSPTESHELIDYFEGERSPRNAFGHGKKKNSEMSSFPQYSKIQMLLAEMQMSTPKTSMLICDTILGTRRKKI